MKRLIFLITLIALFIGADAQVHYYKATNLLVSSKYSDSGWMEVNILVTWDDSNSRVTFNTSEKQVFTFSYIKTTTDESGKHYLFRAVDNKGVKLLIIASISTYKRYISIVYDDWLYMYQIQAI